MVLMQKRLYRKNNFYTQKQNNEIIEKKYTYYNNIVNFSPKGNSYTYKVNYNVIEYHQYLTCRCKQVRLVYLNIFS